MAKRLMRPMAAGVFAPLAILSDRRYGPVRADGLDTKAFAQLRCLKNEVHTHDTRKVTLQLPAPGTSWAPKGPISNVLVGITVQEPGKEQPKEVAKPYNPISVSEAGSFTILVKRYAGGKVGGTLHELKAGESIAVKGGWQQWSFEKGKYSHYGMVAGGTGITPLIQALQYILEHDPQAKVTLLTANKTPQDVLLHDDIAALEKAYAGRLTVHHHVDSAAGTQVTPALLKKVLPQAAPGVLVMVCGPMAMLKAVAGPKAPDFSQGELSGFLKDLGFAEVHVLKV